MAQFSNYILVCGGTGCRASHSEHIITALRKELDEAGLSDQVQVIRTGCFGFCEQGPIVKTVPDNTFYVSVKPEDAEAIVREHIIKGRKVERLLYVAPDTGRHVSDSKHMEFYKPQVRIALRNCGFIDPENINEYIARDGYAALGKVLEMRPEEVIREIMDSGLRGRGGGGFPTGLKWKITREVQADQKYVVCNADEGDPGAFMDRSILEGDPHSIIEAMAINGYCTGASKGMIYIRAEYPLAIHRLEVAIAQAREYGLLGDDIMGTGFSFDIEIRYGAGAFVCGEETALIHSMEGKRGEPTVKPPFPSESGYKGQPTNVNNVETYANIPPIILRGAKWFSSIGTEKSKGTKVFALAGKVNNVGLIEVPMGTTLREVIFDIGGGIKNGKKFKAVQTGGPSGGCLTEKHLDTPIDYDNLLASGSMMGSGGMIVMDEDDCMVSVAKFYLEFTVEESCGKCTPCHRKQTPAGDTRPDNQRQRHRGGPHGTQEPRGRHPGLLPVRTGADCPEPRSLHDGQLLGRIRGARTRQIVSRTPVPRPDELRHRPEGLQRVFALFAGMSHERHQRGTQTALFDRPDGLHQVRHLYGQM